MIRVRFQRIDPLARRTTYGYLGSAEDGRRAGWRWRVSKRSIGSVSRPVAAWDCGGPIPMGRGGERNGRHLRACRIAPDRLSWRNRPGGRGRG